MAMGCFYSLWVEVVPRSPGPQMYPARLGGGFHRYSCRQVSVLRADAPSLSPVHRAELGCMMQVVH